MVSTPTDHSPHHQCRPLLPRHDGRSSAGILTSSMLLRRPLHLTVLRRHLLTVATAPDTSAAVVHPNDPWFAKVVSTVFLLSPSPSSAAARLGPFRHLLSPSTAFEALRRLPDPAASAAFYQLTRSHFNLTHSVAAHQYLIKLLTNSGLHEAALKVFDEMAADCLSTEDSFFQYFVTSLANAGQLDASMGVLARATEFGFRIRPVTLNKITSPLIYMNRVLDAVCFFSQQLRSQSFTPDTCSFNIIIKGLCRLGEIDKVFALLSEMRDHGCSPDTVTYNIVVDGLCRVGQVDRACLILRGIQSDGMCVPNVVTYTAIISSYCKIGRMEEAFRVFEEMVGFGIKPSRITYNVLIDGYGKAVDMVAALRVYDKMVVCGCSPDVVTFTSLIDGYCRSWQLDDAMRLWQRMGEKQLRPNVYTFAIVIHALCKKNRLGEARRFLKELNGRDDLLPRAFIYNPVIDGFCKAGDVDEANTILAEMEERGCSPDKFTYTILIIGHCMKGRVSDAIALFDRMIATRCAPDTITMNSFVSCLLKSGMPNEANHVMLIASKDSSNTSSLSITPLSSRKSQDISVAS